MNTRFAFAAIVLSLACVTPLTAAAPTTRPALDSEPGWVWQIKPGPSGWSSQATQGIVMRQDELQGGELLLTMAYSSGELKDVVRLRPVLFDESGARIESTGAIGGATEAVHMLGHYFPKGSAEKVASIGVEKLTPENLRDVVAPAASKALRDAGVQSLPFPCIDSRYDYELTTIEGKKIKSKDLRGKVVLLDFWATWCTPCMAKLPKLKATYARLHERGFEIIGINHDYTLDAARNAVAKQQLPWPIVLAPTSPEHRRLWQTAVGDGPLPLLLLIDRDGILRAGVRPAQLEAEIEKLVGG